MKKITSLALALVFVVAASTFTGCKKYDDGPTISLRSKKARLANTWKAEKTIYTTSSGNSTTSTASTGTVEFTKDGKVTSTIGSISASGTWDFSSNKEDINVTILGATTTSTILKLKNKELWLKSTDNGTTTETHYVPA